MIFFNTFSNFALQSINIIEFKFYFIFVNFVDLFQILSFFDGKYFQAINLKLMPFLIHNFPVNNKIKIKKTFQLI